MVLIRLIGLVVVLNLVRYLVGGAIESVTIMEPMHRVLPLYPEVFNAEFTTRDFAISLGYNYLLWFAASLQFYLMHPVLKGGWLVKSLKSYGVSLLGFVSLAAVYMNHFTDAVKPFYFWSMVDAVIVFTVVAVANAFLFPRFFKSAVRG